MFNEVEHGPTPQKKKKNLGDTGKLKYMGKRVDTWHGQRPLPKNKVKDKWPQKITSKKKKKCYGEFGWVFGDRKLHE